MMANSEHVKQLERSVEEWNQWRKNHSYMQIRPDLSGADLSDVDLSGADLSDVDLSGADLSDVNLNEADLNRRYSDREERLIGHDLMSTNLSDANLSYANLSKTNLSYANLNGAHLSYANLNGANLSGVHLYKADLIGAHLIGAHLSGVHLSGAHLRDANLHGANLSGADLSGASLSGADLSGADLSGASLRGAHLSNANLIGANLNSADFHRAHFRSILFAQIDLCTVEGLDTVIHDGPSFVDVKTMQFPEGETRIHFLRGAGFSDVFIDYLPSLFTVAIQYASCFISYAHQDELLAQRLYKDLQDKGVRCWFAPHDLRPGTSFHRGIEEAIQIHETVLLLLSEHAVASNWVAHEVDTALNRQARERRELLFPLRLDEAIMRAKDNWAVRLRNSRHIGDFTNWQNDAIYQQHFADLLRHLKVKTT